MSKQLKGSFILLLAAIIWGAALIAQSEGMKYISPFTYLFLRFLLACLVLLPFVLQKNPSSIRRNSTLGGIACGIFLFIGSTFQQYGLISTSPGKAGFISALYLIFVPIISFILFKKKIGINIWVAVILAIVGFYFLCINGESGLQVGDLLILGCAVSFAFQILAADKATEKTINPFIVNFYQGATVVVLSFIGMLIFDHPTITAILDAKWAILYAGIISSGIAYTFQFIGQKDTDPTIASLIMSLESVFSVIFEWLLLNTTLTTSQFIGCGIVFVAVIFAQLPTKGLIHARKN